MTAAGLRKTLLALRKEVRKARTEIGFDVDAHSQKSILSNDEAAWFSAVLFALVQRLGAKLSFDQAVKWSHPSFRSALPPPSACASHEKFVEHAAPYVVSLGEESLGWLYQLFCEQSRISSQDALQQSNKECTTRERIAFTQLYTPRWVSDYLLERCLQPQVAATETPALTVLDPACGAGNILLPALEYLAQVAHSRGARDPFKVALDNIFGADIDPLALFVTNVSLVARALRAGAEITSGAMLVCTDAGDLGSLERDRPDGDILTRTYGVVVTNPPYIGRKLLDRKLKEQLKLSYPPAHHDISAAFLLRGIELLSDNGKLGLITQRAQFFLPSFADMRTQILKTTNIDVFVECGSGAFPLQTGEKVNSALIVIGKKSSSTEGAAPVKPSVFIDISNAREKDAALLPGASEVYLCNQNRFLHATNNNAFNYKTPPFLARLSETGILLSSLADIRQGLATTNNARFVKPWWEVPPEEIGSRWVPYVKGAGSERWWAPIENVVLWENEGEAIKQAVRDSYPYLKGKTAWVVKNETHYFRPGLVFSFVNTRQFCARLLPQGCIFDVAASAIFPSEDRYFILAFLNSSFCAMQASLLNPTINFQVGDLKKLLLPRFSDSQRLEMSELAQQCVELKQAITEMNGTVCGTGALSLPTEKLETWMSTCSQRIAALSSIENNIDAIVIDSVCTTLNLTAKEQSQLQDLCAQERDKRRVPAVFPSNHKDLNELRSRFA